MDKMRARLRRLTDAEVELVYNSLRFPEDPSMLIEAVTDEWHDRCRAKVDAEDEGPDFIEATLD